eukprot:223982-Chlamydomonas_euryale.AAC.1
MLGQGLEGQCTPSRPGVCWGRGCRDHAHLADQEYVGAGDPAHLADQECVGAGFGGAMHT